MGLDLNSINELKLKIHRGAEEIGGTCVELKAGESRIVLDLGMPLTNPDGTDFDSKTCEQTPGRKLLEQGLLPPVDGLYEWQEPRVDGVLISHAHQDHYGLLKHVHPRISVYLSPATQKLIELTCLFTSKLSPLKNTLGFSWPSHFGVGAFRITPHLVDHSGFGAFAFEIEALGKRVFYSGDFREHGYLKKAMDILYKRVKPGVDALLMEGTTLGRPDAEAQTEQSLSEEAEGICRSAGEKAVLIYQSGQNISRSVSFYKAARDSGRLFVLDIYTAHVLSELGEYPGGEKLPRPGAPGFKNVRVWYPTNLTDWLFKKVDHTIPRRYHEYKITKEEMAGDLSKIVMTVRPSLVDDLKRIAGLHGSTLIYSLWDGYKEKSANQEFFKTLQEMDIRIHDLHTSGHADLPALKRMAHQLAPNCLIPIHTIQPDQYDKYFSQKILRATDGQEITI